MSRVLSTLTVTHFSFTVVGLDFIWLVILLSFRLLFYIADVFRYCACVACVCYVMHASRSYAFGAHSVVNNSLIKMEKGNYGFLVLLSCLCFMVETTPSVDSHMILYCAVPMPSLVWLTCYYSFRSHYSDDTICTVLNLWNGCLKCQFHKLMEHTVYALDLGRADEGPVCSMCNSDQVQLSFGPKKKVLR